MSDTWRKICIPLKIGCVKDTHLVEYLKSKDGQLFVFN